MSKVKKQKELQQEEALKSRILENLSVNVAIKALFNEGFELHHVLKPHHVNGKHGFIDSLRVELPIKFIRIIDPRFNAPFIEYYPQLTHVDKETGEVTEYYGLPGSELETIRDEKGKIICHEPKPDRTIEVNGITYRFYFRKTIQTIDKKAVSIEVCVIQISAKMVKSDYFGGITKENIADIVNDINSFGIIEVDLPTFLEYGNPLDIDVCTNYLIEDDDLDDTIKLIEMYCPHKRLNVFKKTIKTKGDTTIEKRTGFEYGSRFIQNKPSSPFCKLYHKGNELLKKSYTFYDNYLNGKVSNYKLDRLVRIEANVQNAKHKKRLKKQGCHTDWKNLNDLLATSSEELAKVVRTAFSNYNGQKVTAPILKDNETPSFATFLLLWLLKIVFKKLFFTKLDLLESVEVYLNLYHKSSSDNTKRQRKHHANRYINGLFEKLNLQEGIVKRNAPNNGIVRDFLRVQGLTFLDLSNNEK